MKVKTQEKRFLNSQYNTTEHFMGLTEPEAEHILKHLTRMLALKSTKEIRLVEKNTQEEFYLYIDYNQGE